MRTMSCSSNMRCPTQKIANPLIVFGNAADARRYFEAPEDEGAPALFILDLLLGFGDTGLDFLRWLRSLAPPLGSTPTMVLTGSEQPEHRTESLDLGALFFLQKPVTANRLTEAVQALGFVVVTSTGSGGMGFRIIERP